MTARRRKTTVRADRSAHNTTPQTIPAWFAALVIVVAGAAAFSNSFSGVFVFDDRTALALNPFIKTLWPLTDALSAPRDTALAGRPVASLSFAVTYALAPADARDVFAARAGDLAAVDRLQRNAWMYHAGNLVIHLLSALALYGVVRRTLRAPALVVRLGSEADGLALAITAIWVVHPLTTAAVTYIVQRTEALMGLLYLATLYCAIRAADSYVVSAFRLRSPLRPRATVRLAVALAKAVRRTFWSIAAIVFCALGMGTKESFVTTPVMVLAWDYLMLDLPWRSVLARWWRLYAALAGTWVLLAGILASAPRSASAGFGLEGVSAWSYLLTQAGVIAHYLRLAFIPWPLSLDYDWPIAASVKSVVWSGLIVSALLGATVWGVTRRAAWSFAGVWFFLILAPTSSVVPIVTEVAADHRMYLPLVSVVAFTVLGAWSLLTVRSAGLSGPRSAALKGPPYTSKAAFVSSASAAAIIVVLAALTHARNEDYSSQERLYAQTVAARPSNARARSNLASVLIDDGRPNEAEPLLREAIRLKPDYPDAYANLGVAYVVEGRSQDALPLFERAVALAPDRAGVWRNYAEALGSVGRFADAAGAFRHALAASPNDPNVLEGLAWILATAPDGRVRDGKAAVDLARRAAHSEREPSPAVLDTLGAAYAENGQFSDAVAAAEQALALARAGGSMDLGPQIERRLQLYRSAQPYREPARP